MKARALPFLRRRVAAAIREQRTALGLSQAGLAERLNCHTDYVGKVERGEQNMTLATLERFFAALIAAASAVGRHPASPPGDMSADVRLLHAFATSIGFSTQQNGINDSPEVTPEVRPEIRRLLCKMREPMTRQSLQRALGLKAEKNFRLVHLRPAIQAGLIAMTIPHKPNSRLQKYRLTAKGKAWLSANPADSPSL